MKSEKDLDEFAVILRRIDGGNLGRLLDLPRRDLSHAATLKPDVLSGSLLRFAQISTRFPQIRFTPIQVAQRRRLLSGRYINAYRNYVQFLHQRQSLLSDVDPSPWPNAERLSILTELMNRYTALCSYAAEGVNKAMDLRLILGALQFHLLRAVTQSVVAYLEDPKVGSAERAKVQTAFAPLLAHKAELLQTAEERRAERKRNEEVLAKELAAAQERTQFLDTLHAVTMGAAVDQASLEKAALLYAEAKDKAASSPKKPKTESDQRRTVPRSGKRTP